MKEPTIEQLMNGVIESAEPIVKNFRQPMDVSDKKDGTPVTDTDKAVNERLSVWFADIPNLGFIGEEGNRYNGETRVLYVDPLDGTGAFIAGQAAVTVVASIMEQDTHGLWYPVMAVIHDPISGEVWAVEKGQGSIYTVNDCYSGLETSSVTVNPEQYPAGATVSTWPNVPFSLDKVLCAVEEDDSFHQYQYGGIALVGGLIASGVRQASLFAGKSAAETVAMSLIVRGAGGIATDLFGKPLDSYSLEEVDSKLDFVLPHGAIMSSHQGLTDRLVEIVKKYNPE